MAGFQGLVDEMDDLVMETLNDGTADYRPPQVGAGDRKGIAVIIERNLQMVGAEGRFQTTLVGVTWLKCRLSLAEPGGLFLFGNERFLVERLIADDGEWLTAACMVQP